jgi:threonine 3-dehydrogenase
MIFGHECAGKIIETGSAVENFKVGDRISVETHIYDGTCFQCKQGNQHICENVKIFGVDTNGVFADYALVPQQNAWLNDPKMPVDVASIQEPFGNAVHTIFEGGAPSCDTAVVFGCGPIGLCAIGILKAIGAAAVYAVEPLPFRAKLAHKMGATRVLNPNKENVIKEILAETRGKGVGAVIEMSGNASALQNGLKVLRPGGKVGVLGVFANDVSLNVSDGIVFKYARVFGINGRRIWSTWEKTRELLVDKKVDVRPIITHRFALRDFEKGFAAIAAGEAGKVILTP